MMAVIPTFHVEVKRNASEKFTMRVPKTDLDAFLRVLTFNGCQEFAVVEEKRPDHNSVSAYVTDAAGVVAPIERA